MTDRTTSGLLGRIDRTTWALIAAFVGLGLYLAWDRGGPFLDGLAAALPWLVVLACPLLHLLMHRGHGGHGGRGGCGQHDAPGPGAGHGAATTEKKRREAASDEDS